MLSINPLGIILGSYEAEFRIAIHPDRTGKGLGKEVTLSTLKTGFGHLNLSKVHLIVRKNNPLALRLYQNIGIARGLLNIWLAE